MPELGKTSGPFVLLAGDGQHVSGLARIRSIIFLSNSHLSACCSYRALKLLQQVGLLNSASTPLRQPVLFFTQLTTHISAQKSLRRRHFWRPT